MPAYVIFYVEAISDPQLLERYKATARPVLQEAGGKVMVAYGRHEVLEGAPLAGVVVVEFPTFDAARTWYHSAAYSAASAMRKSAAKAHAVLVEGFAPPQSPAPRSPS
jgi:uncharacterized protein (DUF1330 family)